MKLYAIFFLNFCKKKYEEYNVRGFLPTDKQTFYHRYKSQKKKKKNNNKTNIIRRIGTYFFFNIYIIIIVPKIVATAYTCLHVNLLTSSFC